jgi:hypothetical protein
VNLLACNIAIAIGLVLIGGGASAEWGLPIGAMAFGVLLVILPFVGIIITRKA